MTRAARPFTFLAALSLVLSAGATVLVVRSYWVAHVLVGQRFDDESLTALRDDFILSQGRLGYGSSRTVFFTPQDFANYIRWNSENVSPGWTHRTTAAPSANLGRAGTHGDVSWRALGFAYQWQFDGGPATRANYRSRTSRSVQRLVVPPPWALIGPWLVLPAWWVRRWWGRRFARRPGLCPACGYDLRASPGRCPECGAEPPVVPASRSCP